VAAMAIIIAFIEATLFCYLY